jgi:ABC-type protease/lipase transport system fused ATPase/permease subunit
MQRTKEPQQPFAITEGTDLVQVEHLCRTISNHAQKTMLLDDISFSVPAGSLFAINGPSGSAETRWPFVRYGRAFDEAGRLCREQRF